jgi:hexosaminidase
MKSKQINFLKLLFITIVFFNGVVMSQNSQTLNLMPVPKEMTIGEGKFRLTPAFKMKIEGKSSDRLVKYSTGALKRLSGRTGLFFLQDIVSGADSIVSPAFSMKFDREGALKVGEDESYKLTVSSAQVNLSAITDIGLMRGLETFLQLVDKDKEGYFLPFVKINDSPFYKWRGLMLDVCRHWMPLEMVLRNIDGMAAVKMNVLHFHLSEDQGFRVESKVFPKLHEMGSDGNYFTQDQIKYIIKYAGDRGIRVYPEFDVPGHATAWLVGYPELASKPGPYKIERNWGVFGPVINPASENTYSFLEKFFTEMSALFPDEYFHIGGDEVKAEHWKENPDIQKFMSDNKIKDVHALQTYFNNRLLKILQKNNKKMVGWDEILQPEMPKDIVIHSWRGKKALLDASKDGYSVILSNNYYIDLIQPTWFHYQNHPISPDTTLPTEQMKNILGGEATMWSELVTNENVDSRIWPRTAAIAERFWSKNTVTDTKDMYRRLDKINLQLEEVGLLHEKNYDMMLRRLTGGEDTRSLRMLVDILEPVKIYTRHRYGVKYTSFSPYSRVVDASRPDSKTARNFNDQVDELIQNKNQANLNLLLKQVAFWKTGSNDLLPLIVATPILWEVKPHAESLISFSNIMPEFLNAVYAGKKIDEKTLLKAEEFLKNNTTPYGQAELMVLSSLDKLVKHFRK